MNQPLQRTASSALDQLHQAAITLGWDHEANGIARAKQVIEDDDASAEVKLNEVIGICAGLSRGEWDRNFVERGVLTPIAAFEVPWSLYRYCETLPLDSSLLDFVRQQLACFQRAVDCHHIKEESRKP